jgi:hypothetical protein
MGPYLRDLSPRPSGESAGHFLLEIKNPFYLRQMKSPAKQQALLEVVHQVTGAPWKVSVTSAPPAGGSATPPPGAEDPAKAQEPPPAAGPSEGLSTNPIVKKSLDLFGGRLV